MVGEEAKEESGATQELKVQLQPPLGEPKSSKNGRTEDAKVGEDAKEESVAMQELQEQVQPPVGDSIISTGVRTVDALEGDVAKQQSGATQELQEKLQPTLGEPKISTGVLTAGAVQGNDAKQESGATQELQQELQPTLREPKSSTGVLTQEQSQIVSSSIHQESKVAVTDSFDDPHSSDDHVMTSCAAPGAPAMPPPWATPEMMAMLLSHMTTFTQNQHQVKPEEDAKR
jgi:hypothetical protein